MMSVIYQRRDMIHVSPLEANTILRKKVDTRILDKSHYRSFFPWSLRSKGFRAICSSAHPAPEKDFISFRAQISVTLQPSTP